MLTLAKPLKFGNMNKARQLFVILGFLLTFHLRAKPPELVRTSISECAQEGTRTLLLHEIQIKKHLGLRVGAHLNCSVNPESEVTYEWNNDTLNIIVQEVQIQIDSTVQQTNSEDGITVTTTVSETRSLAMCRCYYTLDLVFENVKKKPSVILINGLTFSQNYNTRTIRELVVPPKNEYICEMYHPESETYNTSYNYSGKWDFDGDGTTDSLFFIGNGGAHAYYFLRIVLSSDQVRRDYPTVHLDMPYLSSAQTLSATKSNPMVQLVIHDFDRDGNNDIYLDFDNDFSYIPQEWKKQGLTKKRTVLYFKEGELEVKS